MFSCCPSACVRIHVHACPVAFYRVPRRPGGIVFVKFPGPGNLSVRSWKT